MRIFRIPEKHSDMGSRSGKIRLETLSRNPNTWPQYGVASAVVTENWHDSDEASGSTGKRSAGRTIYLCLA